MARPQLHGFRNGQVLDVKGTALRVDTRRSDGLRLVAWLARYVEPGKDPLRTLVELACQAGWDVDPIDMGWAQGTDGVSGV
jgi:predicted NAD/FAD-dependent oxidoreductase